MKYALVLFALALALVANSCKEQPTAPDERTTLSLSVADSTCTDIELNLKTSAPNGQRLVIERQTANQTPVVIFDAVLNKPDTLVLDTGLFPNTPYAYRAYRLANNTKTDPSPELQARTMDTTSHEWTWTVETFGDFASSVFYDVAIINDTLAYAVGQIYLNDSLGQRDPTPYNLAIWNGHAWRFERRQFSWRLLYPNSGGDPFGTSSITSIYAFGPSDIWVAANTVQHWNGSTWTEHAAIAGYDSQGFPFAAGGALKIWGSSSSNLYFVGRGGLIIHYNGFEWRRIESGTTLNFYDVYGDGEEVLAVASTRFESPVRNALLSITRQGIVQTRVAPSSRELSGIWFIANRYYAVVGAGIHEKRQFSDSSWKSYAYGQINFQSSGGVRGNSVNDVFIVGGSEALHWNGQSWQNYTTALGINDARVGEVKVKGNLAFSVGALGQGIGDRALVVIWRRYNSK